MKCCFAGGGWVQKLLALCLTVPEVRAKQTTNRCRPASLPATIKTTESCFRAAPAVRREILKLIERWQPTVAFSDREIFLPSAARAAGLECLSIDHSHVVLACRYPVPPSQFASRALARIEDELLFNETRRNLIVSF